MEFHSSSETCVSNKCLVLNSIFRCAFGSYAILCKEEITMRHPAHSDVLQLFSLNTIFLSNPRKREQSNRHCRICHMCIIEHLTVVQTGEVFPAVIAFNSERALMIIVMSRPACLASN